MDFNIKYFLLVVGFGLANSAFVTANEASTTTRPSSQPTSRIAKLRKDVDVKEFEKLYNEKKYVVIDVRTSKEFMESHIPDAINLDLNSSDFEKAVGELDKSKTYLVHCAKGVRSVRACDKMEKLNFVNLYNLKGGFEAWKYAGKPKITASDSKEKN